MVDLTPSAQVNIFSATCEVCTNKLGKYRCPGCDVVMCSIECSKSHKKSRQCSGKRSRSQFVPKKMMDSDDLVNDVRLLEDAKRAKTTNSRTAHRLAGGPAKHHGLTKRRRQLLDEARKSGVRLVFMPNFMQRHKENTSFFDFRRLMILWRVEFIFEGRNQHVLVLPNVEDTKTLGEIMSELIRRSSKQMGHLASAMIQREHNKELLASFQHGVVSSSMTSSLAALHQPIVKLATPHGAPGKNQTSSSEASITALADAVSVDYPERVEDWAFYLKHTKCPANNMLYFRLFASDNLRRALSHRDVIEYPSIIVVPPSASSQYREYTDSAFDAISRELQSLNEARLKKLEDRDKILEDLVQLNDRAERERLRLKYNLPRPVMAAMLHWDVGGETTGVEGNHDATSPRNTPQSSAPDTLSLAPDILLEHQIDFEIDTNVKQVIGDNEGSGNERSRDDDDDDDDDDEEEEDVAEQAPENMSSDPGDDSDDDESGGTSDAGAESAPEKSLPDRTPFHDPPVQQFDLDKPSLLPKDK